MEGAPGLTKTSFHPIMGAGRLYEYVIHELLRPNTFRVPDHP
jgi:hypothetical protein